MKRIDPADLVSMDSFAGAEPLRIDIVYAQGAHPDNLFKTAIYRSEARLWLHRDLASVVLRAARHLYEEEGYFTVLKDGLRTVEAQAAMQETPIVKGNPHWCEEPNRLLSPPGRGAHPRGMAIDLVLETEGGKELDMGTPFDYLTPDPADNPARRDNKDLPELALNNRRMLEGAMLKAAQEEGVALLPLPSEWWDFRFPREIYDAYAPLADVDLPPEMKMVVES